MKKIVYIAQLCVLTFGLSACSDWFLDKEPQDERTDVVYFKTPSHFKEYTAGFRDGEVRTVVIRHIWMWLPICPAI